MTTKEESLVTRLAAVFSSALAQMEEYRQRIAKLEHDRSVLLDIILDLTNEKENADAADT